MSVFEERLKNKLSALRFDWDERMFSQTDKSMSTTNFDIQEEQVNKNGEIVDGIVIFKFTASQKENQEKPLIDQKVATLARYSFSEEKPPIQMRQIFHTDAGILPSKKCILQRAQDYISCPAKMRIEAGASLKERLTTEYANLGFDFGKMEIYLPSDKTYFVDTSSLEHISAQSDQLVTIFDMSPNIDQNTTLIEGMSASLTRTTPKGDIYLMHEVHYTKYETLHSKNQLYNRAVEMLCAMKILEKFGKTGVGHDLKNT